MYRRAVARVHNSSKVRPVEGEGGESIWRARNSRARKVSFWTSARLALNCPGQVERVLATGSSVPSASLEFLYLARQAGSKVPVDMVQL